MPHTVIAMFKLCVNLSDTTYKGFLCHSYKTDFSFADFKQYLNILKGFIGTVNIKKACEVYKHTLDNAFQDQFWENMDERKLIVG
jgi:hypothetical protein